MAKADSSKKRKVADHHADEIPAGQRVKIQVDEAPPNSTGPVIACLPVVRPPSSTEFKVYADSNGSHRILAGETDRVEFFSDSRTHDPPACQYLVGAFDPATSTLDVIPAPFHALSTRVKALKDLPPIQSTSASNEARHAVARATLGTAFGTKKAQRAIKTAERNRIDADAMAHVRDHLVASITAQSAALPTTAQLQASTDAARPIPPFNLEAKTPQDVYDISYVVSAAELAALPLEDILHAFRAKDAIARLPFRSSNWVNSRISKTWAEHPNGKLDKRQLKRVRTLVYISYLLAFRAAGHFGGFAALQKRLTVSAPKPAKQEDDVDEARPVGGGALCPDVVVEGLIRRYTELAQGSAKPAMTSASRQKLLGYLATLCLWYDDFTCPLGSLSNDLQMDPKRLHEVFKSLGCKLEKPSSAEQQAKVEEAKRAGRDANEVLKERTARLVVPLTFPAPKRKKR